MAAVAVAAAVGLTAGCRRSGPAGAAKNQLNVFIWSEYIDPEIVADFEKQFDCKVTMDLYEDNESMIAKLQGGGVSLYDIVVPSDYVVPAMIKRGLLAELRHENIPNLANLDPQFAGMPADPGNTYTAPYQWGTVGLYVRRSAGETIDETWGLVFDAAKQPGPFVLMEDMRAMFAAALIYKGFKANSTEPAELQSARDAILEAKGRSLGFEGGVGGKNRVLAKGCRMAMVYNGDAVRGTVDDPETYYFVPREGAEIWLDSLCVPAEAPHRDLAEKFINFILDPEVGARLSNFNQYATPNKASLEFINPDDLKNPAIYPSAEIRAKLQFLEDLGDKIRLYDELWTQVKSK
jgi:spermidine/putrescine transport system substrate-binding protein